MPNETSVLHGQRCYQLESRSVMSLHQGDCIRLRSNIGLFKSLASMATTIAAGCVNGLLNPRDLQCLKSLLIRFTVNQVSIEALGPLNGPV